MSAVLGGSAQAPRALSPAMRASVHRRRKIVNIIALAL